MAQIATFPDVIPSLDDAPEIPVTEYATEGSLQFLLEQGASGVKKDIFFTDRIPVLLKGENDVNKQCGSSVVIISEGIARGQECYFVSINTEAKFSPTSEFSSTITAYVGANLETISQSVYEVTTTSEETVEHIMEAILDESGRMVISESITGKLDNCVSISAKAAKGLILEGAENVMFRILAGNKIPQWYWFLSISNGHVWKKSYSVMPGCTHQCKSTMQVAENVTRINTSVDLIKERFRATSRMDISNQEALSVVDLVREARAEDGFDDNFEEAKCEFFYQATGQCIYSSKSSCEWYIELPILAESSNYPPVHSHNQ
ncbi:hypothetical protein HDU97_001802 [Phlyctochytrium planicorne]|nr:hypothetical protein HDU97_001802 [Phlyctochytrium planicorne]